MQRRFTYGGQCTLNGSCGGGAIFLTVAAASTCTITSIGNPVSATALQFSYLNFYYTRCDRPYATMEYLNCGGKLTKNCNSNQGWSISCCCKSQLTIGNLQSLQSLSVIGCLFERLRLLFYVDQLFICPFSLFNINICFQY